MSDSSLGNADFDVEAQESLLEQPPSEEEICDFNLAERSNTSTTCVHADNRFLRSCILVIHSTLLFKSRAHNYASSSSSPYSSIQISDIYKEGSGADADSDTSTANIELQQVLLQRESVSEIVKMKNLELLRSFGGVGGVADALNTHLQNGIRIPNQTFQRKPSQVSQVLIRSFLKSCNNCTVFLLACAAVLSIGFGIKEDGREMGWFDGVVLLATVFIIVLGTTVRKCCEQWSNNKSQLGRKLDVQIVREGITHLVGEVDLVVGDISLVRKGDLVPADGLFVGGSELQLDDGSINPTTIDESNPFMFYGSRVINGDGRMLITTTGVDTVLGEMMSQAANKGCNFECYLNKLFVCLHLSALLVSILIVVVLFLRYASGKLDDERRYRPDSKGEPTQLKTFVEALKAITTGSKGTARVVTTLLSVSLLGIMEGIPLVISMATMIWSRKTFADNALVSNPFACVNIKGLTTICTDIYGGMTERDFEFDKLYIGDHGFVSEITPASHLVDALRDVIAAPCLLSATDHDPELDHCILSWAESELGVDRSLIEKSKMIIPHCSRNTLLGQSQHSFQLTMEINGNGGYFHCKGHPDHILPLCSHHYGIDGIIREMDGERKRELEMDIGHMLVEEEEARVIAYACKHVILDSSHDLSDQPVDDLAFLAMISMRKLKKIEDIKEAVARLKVAGIRSILTSGEHVSVLKGIGERCGLLANNSDDDGVVITGEEFRLLSDDDRVGIIEKICIVGNCSPGDKFLLIKCLKEAGEVVAMVAQQTVDAPALKLADIGITYGASSEMARDCSDITAVDGTCCFGLVARAVESGRAFFGNVRKFIQLQLIFGVSSSLINFIASVALGDAPITAVQLFWLSLVVPLAGGLALLTGSAAGASSSSEKPLITRDMWRNIGVQVCYQTGVLVALQHKGQDFLGTTGAGVKLIIYNAFFLCQAFNIFIAREPRKKNIFAGVYHNHSWFWVALLLFTLCQAAFAAAEEFIGSSPGLHLRLWGVCLLIAFLSCPMDLAAKILLLFLN